jgi:hypothetical protein
MKDEAFYRERAREARRLAAASPDVETRMSWLDIAEDYYALADSAKSVQAQQKRKLD